MNGEIHAAEFAGQEQEQIERLKRNPAYKKVQEELALKKDDRKRVQALDKNLTSQFQDKVEIRTKFKWNKDEKHGVQIEAESSESMRGTETGYGKSRILDALGYKIDIASRVGILKENFQKLYIETKSHNLLLAKFNQLKYSAVQMLLTLLGVSTEELQELQKQALDASVEENERLFAENEYNTEMLGIFSSGKKDRARAKIFDEVRGQLITQMTQLGKKDYYTKERITQIKLDQVKQIQRDLLQEQQNLEYVRDFQ